jgi:hypothetical protein
VSARRIALPCADEVQAAIAAERAESGRDPSVLGVARRLGLANTTFRRNFPRECAELAVKDTSPQGSHAAGTYRAAKDEATRLRQANRELTEQLEFALAAIQRLSIDNARLTEALHQARGVTRLPRPRAAGS